ncbi:MFS transporter [Paraburkholderia fynbosensis]|uniref:Inner membrane transport protein RhmT n=1 Tax=Paraburkholderia fynbosensis TaxID=1200993 RepID=A0A6J5H2U0_9BURK|nr:MFS transporter [Paraburkholderia fynbosensis]CAB3810670.1 Inner membrane transport protein RhmT [Paraburkholderia fynbosensis]
MNSSREQAPPLDRAVRKASARLLPFLCLMLVLAFLDRANIGFAKIAYQADTGIGDAAFALGAGIFFIGYAMFEVPSNLIMQRVGARVWLSRIMVTWGIVSAAMMFAHTPTMLYVLRFLLGVCEAGFYPGVLLYLSYWFPARQRARATGLFYLGVPLSLVLGSPLSGWLLTVHGLFGLTNWQLMFVVEGLAATLAGVAAFFYLESRPRDAKWLDEDEKRALSAVLDAEERCKLNEVRHSALGVLKDAKVLIFIGVYFFIQVGTAPLTFYLPARLTSVMGGKVDLGIGVLLAIPWLCSALATRIATVHADRRDNHRRVAMVMVLAGSLALASIAWISDPRLMVLACCIAVPGLTASQPVFWSLPTRYLAGTGAASGIAFIVSIGNLGAFLSPQVKALTDAQLHDPNAGFLAVAALCFLSVILLAFANARGRAQQASLLGDT